MRTTLVIGVSRVLSVCALLLLAACGNASSSGSSDQSDGPTTSSEPTGSGSTSPAAKGCPYLTADQVSDTIGTPVTETAGTVHACFFDPPGGGEGPGVMLSRIDLQIDPSDYARQSKALCQGEVTDLEIGDEAFACVGALGPQGQLYQGRVLIAVTVDDVGDDATGIADAVALLHEVTIPPSAG
jgi:ABC-type phosphate transport system substrate-binding protein